MSAVIEHVKDLQSRLAEVRGAVWDLDNTLYRLNELTEDAFNIAFARAAIESGVALSLHDAIEASRRSWKEHGYSGHVFVHQYGLNTRDLHYKYHGFMDEKIISASEEVRSFFENLPLRHVLITHSHRSWAERVLAHLGLDRWFAEGHVLGLEDYDFRHKHACATPFEYALDRLGLPAAQTVMVEDTLPNLKIPYELGMMTAYIHHGRRLPATPDFVHLSCDSTVDFLSHLAGNRNSNAHKASG